MNRRDVVGIDFLPAVDVIEQFGRSALRAHQGGLDLVLVQEAEQVFRLHQSGRSVMIDEEYLAVQLGTAIDEGCDVGIDHLSAELKDAEDLRHTSCLEQDDGRWLRESLLSMRA